MAAARGRGVGDIRALPPIVRGAAIAVLAAGLLYASGAPCTAPPAPDAKKRAVAEGHAKASSYAPQPRPRNHAYGAPIQKPILSKHKRPKRRTDKSAPPK